LEPITQEEIPHMIKSQLGLIHTIRFPRQGHTSDVAIIESDKGTTILKRCRGEQYAAWLRREAFILDCLSQTKLPVPKVYLYEQEDKQQGIQAWLHMECLQGETVRHTLLHENDPVVRHDILNNYGRMLRELHGTPCPNELKDGDPWLDRMLTQAEYNLIHYKVDGSRSLLDSLKRNKLLAYKQTLIHGDCTIDNVLVHEGIITGVIDWSGGAFGDPRYDVCLAVRPKPNIFQTAEDYNAFFAGYGEKIINDQDYEYYENGLYAFF
jgi:aminoglycoside phosphotransferase (APT) family kinase protein